MKKFIKYFFIVLIVEIVLWVLIILIQSGNNGFLRRIAYYLQELMSLPLSLIDRSYPYWAPVSLGFSVLMLFSTLLFHTLAVYFFMMAAGQRKRKSA